MEAWILLQYVVLRISPGTMWDVNETFLLEHLPGQSLWWFRCYIRTSVLTTILFLELFLKTTCFKICWSLAVFKIFIFVVKLGWNHFWRQADTCCDQFCLVSYEKDKKKNPSLVAFGCTLYLHWRLKCAWLHFFHFCFVVCMGSFCPSLWQAN